MPEIAEAVDISKALAIEGFMQPLELEWLAREAQSHKRIAEVGSYYGRSTRALCDHAQGEVHAFDDFFGPRDIAIDYRKRMMIFQTFCKNLDAYLEPGGKLIVHDEDHDLVKPEGLFDMIFIDGSHEYFDFKRDLEKWIPYLADGGLLCGHDYDLAYPGVLQALFETLGNGCVAVAPQTTIWYGQAK